MSAFAVSDDCIWFMPFDLYAMVLCLSFFRLCIPYPLKISLFHASQCVLEHQLNCLFLSLSPYLHLVCHLLCKIMWHMRIKKNIMLNYSLICLSFGCCLQNMCGYHCMVCENLCMCVQYAFTFPWMRRKHIRHCQYHGTERWQTLLSFAIENLISVYCFLMFSFIVSFLFRSRTIVVCVHLCAFVCTRVCE